MSYLDPKERVIDLRLTSYGRYLISIGKLKPVYYGFFDDDIIYDAEYAGVDDEEQSAIEPRIQEDTPRFAAQSIFSARELAIFHGSPNVINDLIIGSELEDEEKLAQGLIKIQEGPEGAEVLQQPLGKTNSFYPYAPAWNVSFLKAQMSSSSEYQTITESDGTLIKNIPQLNANIQYNIIRNGPNSEGTTNLDGGMGQAPGDINLESIITFDDGGTIELQQDALILRIEESNTFFQNDNFEIECFRIETVTDDSGNEKEHLTSLNFRKPGTSTGIEYEQGTIEQYFRFVVDGEIPPEEICPLIKEDKVNQIYQSKIFECSDFEGLERENIYEEEDDTGDICE
tara:strand:+ start:140 stop:1165 length:1026 start_codon:yes stop_codon:yes gene_type:complete